jgi:hypothetical protein
MCMTNSVPWNLWIRCKAKWNWKFRGNSSSKGTRNFPCMTGIVQSTERNFPCMTRIVQSTERNFPCMTGRVLYTKGIFAVQILSSHPLPPTGLPSQWGCPVLTTVLWIWILAWIWTFSKVSTCQKLFGSASLLTTFCPAIPPHPTGQTSWFIVICNMKTYFCSVPKQDIH